MPYPGLVHLLVNTLGWSSLRPLQQSAVEPLVAGQDALLLASTAGGRTEAATFPSPTAMTEQDWRGLSVLNIWAGRPCSGSACPLTGRQHGFAAVTIACEPTGHRWQVLAQLTADRSMPFACVHPLTSPLGAADRGSDRRQDR